MSSIEAVSDLLSTPEGERAEWINKIIGQVWPFVTVLARDTVKREIQPLLREALSPVLDSFVFVTIDFGDIPPRVEEVKVYTSPEKPDEISIDSKIKYVSDSTFEADVVVASLGIENFSLEGTVRVMLRPLMDKVPLIGGLSICFLNMPVINFKLTGLANILKEIKSTFIMSKVYKVVGDMAVIPNRVFLPLTQGLDMKQLLFLEPQGVLRVKLLGASILHSGDIIGKGDPYAIVTVGVQSYKTKVVSGSTRPNWNEEFEFIVDEKYGQTVTLQVMDADSLDGDDDIGRTSLDISDVVGQFSVDKTLRLMLKDKENGNIQVQTTFYRLSSDPKDIGSATVVPGNPQALLVVFVGSAELPKTAQKGPYLARVSVGDTSQDSKTSEGAAALAFNKTFRFLVVNPKEASLKMQILEKDSQKMVGETSLALMYLPKADNMQMDSELPLVGGVGSVRVAVTLRALTSV